MGGIGSIPAASFLSIFQVHKICIFLVIYKTLYVLFVCIYVHITWCGSLRPCRWVGWWHFLSLPTYLHNAVSNTGEQWLVSSIWNYLPHQKTSLLRGQDLVTEQVWGRQWGHSCPCWLSVVPLNYLKMFPTCNSLMGIGGYQTQKGENWKEHEWQKKTEKEKDGSKEEGWGGVLHCSKNAHGTCPRCEAERPMD